MQVVLHRLKHPLPGHVTIKAMPPPPPPHPLILH